MPIAMHKQWHFWLWKLARSWHYVDFQYLLPLLGRLPLLPGYYLAQWRGKLNGYLGKDWRSMALGFRHIWRQSALGLQMMAPNASDAERAKWRRERYSAEARDEYDARLIARGRIHELTCTITPPHLANLTHNRTNGLLLLTPHYESALIGIPFLAQQGGTINCMTSTVTQDPRVDPAVRLHFEKKYRGLEKYTNGGKFVDMELGVRPFYRMLENHETLVVLADAPPLPQGASQSVFFVGSQRELAGGPLRIARSTHSQIGGYLCRCIGPGKYELHLHPPMPADDPLALEKIYDFFSHALLRDPGGWWAHDLLPPMQLSDHTPNPASNPTY